MAKPLNRFASTLLAGSITIVSIVSTATILSQKAFAQEQDAAVQTTSQTQTQQQSQFLTVDQLMQQVQGIFSSIDAAVQQINNLPKVLENVFGNIQVPNIFGQEKMGKLGIPDPLKAAEEANKTPITGKMAIDAVPERTRKRNMAIEASAKLQIQQVLSDEAQESGKQTRQLAGNLSNQAIQRVNTTAEQAQASVNAAQVTVQAVTDAQRAGNNSLGMINSGKTANEAAQKAVSTQDAIKNLATIQLANVQTQGEMIAAQVESVKALSAISGQNANINNSLQGVNETLSAQTTIQSAQTILEDQQLRLQASQLTSLEEQRKLLVGQQQAEITQRAAEVSGFGEISRHGFRPLAVPPKK